MSSITGTESAAAASETVMAPWAAALLQDQPLANYHLIEALAASERAAVFKAEDRRLERVAALKIMVPEKTPSGEVVENFFDEARAVARVRAPGKLVRALDVGRSGPLFFYASQYLPGGSLASRMVRRERRRWYEKEALAVVRDAAEGLQALFEQGLVHRRLAPGNLLHDDTAKHWAIGDVGCATEIAFGGPEEAVGARPDYASPEQCAGEINVDIRTDLYALGVLWYQLVTEELPFAAPTAEETMRMHRETEPTAPRERDPRLSQATSRLIMWLLSKERDSRPRTPRDFLAKLRQHPLLAEVDAETETEADSEAPPAPETRLEDKTPDAEFLD